MAKCDPIKEALPLSKLSPGTLNELVRNETYENFSIPDDNFFDVFVKMARTVFGQKYTILNRTWEGIVIQVLDPEETQRLVSSSDYKKIASVAGVTKVKACRVHIPAIHSSRCLPNEVYNPSVADKEILEAFYPVFISETDELGKKPLNPTDRVKVKITNELGGGVYVKKINEKSSVSVWKRPTASSASFKCSILRLERIENAKGQTVTAGTTLTPPQSSSQELSAATLKQQYIKYLYIKERFFNKKLTQTWNQSVFKAAIENASQYVGGASLSKRFIWSVLYKLSGYSATGLTNRGDVSAHITDLDTHYGIFKTTLEQYDTLAALPRKKGYPEGISDTMHADLATRTHSDLLDPDFAIKFFISDFRKYLVRNNIPQKKWGILEKTVDQGGLSDAEKKIVTGYFTKNDKRVDFLFKDFYKIADMYDEVTEQPSNQYGQNIIKVWQEFPTFKQWIAAAQGGVSINLTAVGKQDTSQKPPENSPNLQQNKGKDTKDECHDNYPSKDPYLIHVDAQKRNMQRFLETKLAGEELKYLSNRHVGDKTISMAGKQLKVNFKVVRHDGTMTIPQDSGLWFDADNQMSNFIKKPGYASGVYRPRSLITHFVVHSLNGSSDHKRHYRDTLSFLRNTQGQIPHFLISPMGQIIQLVDIAVPIQFGLPTDEFSINAAFVEGVGGRMPFISDNENVVIKNHVLVKNKKNEKIYKPHKIGSKAALEAMQKLIQVCVNNTNIKYRLAAQDFKLRPEEINKSNIQAFGHYKGVGGMNFIYYSWAYGLAYQSMGENILSSPYFPEEGYV